MARTTRALVFAPNEIAILHLMGRVERRCFLLSDDPITGKNYDLLHLFRVAAFTCSSKLDNC